MEWGIKFDLYSSLSSLLVLRWMIEMLMIDSSIQKDWGISRLVETLLNSNMGKGRKYLCTGLVVHKGRVKTQPPL